jgi:hypothetical protein
MIYLPLSFAGSEVEEDDEEGRLDRHVGVPKIAGPKLSLADSKSTFQFWLAADRVALMTQLHHPSQ